MPSIFQLNPAIWKDQTFKQMSTASRIAILAIYTTVDPKKPQTTIPTLAMIVDINFEIIQELLLNKFITIKHDKIIPLKTDEFLIGGGKQ